MESGNGQNGITISFPNLEKFSNHNSHFSTSSSASSRQNSTRASKEFTKYQRALLNKLGYFAVSTTRINGRTTQHFGSEYQLEGNTLLATCIYWTLHLNAGVKAIFLGFLVMNYFGPVVFLDKIAALDYILCFLLVVVAGLIWFRRYPFYEILQANWKVVDTIYEKLGSPPEHIKRLNRDQQSILLSHSAIVWIGCGCLMMQYFADPKYCTFTYSIVPQENESLRLVFAVHEFLFMILAWNVYAASCSLCIFQAITLSSILNQMNETLHNLCSKQGCGYRENVDVADETDSQLSVIDPNKVAYGTQYDIDRLLFDYKQLMLINKEFNEWVSYKTLCLHIFVGCQYVSDVFAGTHILKIPGTGFMDVWFYIEDCFAGWFMLIRTYVFMGLVWESSSQFLQTLDQYLTIPNRKRKYLRKLARSLRPIAINVGPCPISSISALTVMDTMTNYYVCAALW